MYPDEMDQPFESIESGHEFMNLLAETILEVMRDLNRDHKSAVQDGELRRADAIELAIFKLKTLNCHVHKSRRIFNDLRTIRRLLLNERQAAERTRAAAV